MSTKQFWMLWNESGKAPSFKHPSRAEAEMEACRLIEKSPHSRFYVLEAVAEFAFIYPPLKVTSLADGAELKPPRDCRPDEIPF